MCGSKQSRLVQPDRRLLARFLLVLLRPAGKDTELSARGLSLITPRVTQEGRDLAHHCSLCALVERGSVCGRIRVVRKVGSKQVVGRKAAEHLRGVGKDLLGVGARDERRDRRRLLLRAAAPAQPPQPPVDAPAVGGRQEERGHGAGGAGCEAGNVAQLKKEEVV